MVFCWNSIVQFLVPMALLSISWDPWESCRPVHLAYPHGLATADNCTNCVLTWGWIPLSWPIVSYLQLTIGVPTWGEPEVQQSYQQIIQNRILSIDWSQSELSIGDFGRWAILWDWIPICLVEEALCNFWFHTALLSYHETTGIM